MVKDCNKPELQKTVNSSFTSGKKNMVMNSQTVSRFFRSRGPYTQFSKYKKGEKECVTESSKFEEFELRPWQIKAE